MKVETKQPKKEFQPIEMTITFESEEELCNMWHRLNIRAIDVHKPEIALSKHIKFKANDLSCEMIWLEIDGFLRDLHS